jgi:hypothetical protein
MITMITKNMIRKKDKDDKKIKHNSSEKSLFFF